MPTKLTLGHRPDPDDAFKYCALARGAIDTEGLQIELVRGDSAELAGLAERGDLQVGSLSIPAYAKLADRFQPLTSGGSVGDGVGPLIVSNRVFIEDELGAETTIHSPSEMHTGWLVLRLYAPDCSMDVAPFDRILPMIVDDEIETGVLVSEGQIVFGNFGVFKIEDLGEWWKLNSGGHPLPLDVCGVSRALDLETRQKVQRVVRRSIDWALEQHEEALKYASDLGRELDPYGVRTFISTYVNPFTSDLGEAGTAGVMELLRRSAEKGLVAADVPFDPVPVE